MGLYASLIAGIIVLAFALFGQAILHQFGLSMGALRLGGGLLLLYISFEMIFAGQSMHSDTPDTRSIVVSPLAIPMLAGPGSMSFAMISFANADAVGRVGVVLAIIAASAVGAILLALAGEITKLLGKEALRGIERITAILLAIIAAQMIMLGIKAFFL
jgi:multiple antibiotic resistance protein